MSAAVTRIEDVPESDLIEAAWRTPDLTYLLNEDQESLLDSFLASGSRVFVANCARRYGKDRSACVLAIQACLEEPGIQIRYAAPTQKMVRTIVTPHFKQLLEECPEDLRPTERVQDGIWRFPNGSEIHVAGADSESAIDRLRGVATDLAIISEAGFIDGLEYLVHSVLMPQLLTTNGRILLISTPPVTPAHPFFAYCARAESEGAYVKRTIYDAGHITAAQIEEFCAEAGGEDASTWRREYLCEFVVDEESAVIPEFARFEPEIVRPFEMPEHFDAYVATDVGFYDLTFSIFAVTDFQNAQTLVIDELVHRQATSDVIDADIEAKERELWPHLLSPAHLSTHPHHQEPRRIVDAPPIVVAELRKRGRSWVPAKKDDADAALNALRLAIAARKLSIHPRCRQLASHLRHAVWNKARSSFERSGDMGHFDGVDAAKYLVRHVDTRRNPFPALAPGVSSQTHHIFKRADPNKGVSSLFRRR
jgi:hypothetical protein